MSLDVTLRAVITREECVFDYNISHNLGKMASNASIYYQLWRPEEVGVSIAGDLIKPLEQGLYLLKTQKDKFVKDNPENGWGDYNGLVEFVSSYLSACKNYPQAKIEISR